MAYAPLDEDFRPDHVRSRRQRKPPFWLKEYEVDLPRPVVLDEPRQHVAGIIDSRRQRERLSR